MAPPVLGPTPPVERWRIRVPGGKTLGPFPTDLIALGIERGKVPIQAEICLEGAGVWRPLATVPAFFRAVGLRRGAAPLPPAAEAEEDEVTRITAPITTDPDDDDPEDEATRVLDALRLPLMGDLSKGAAPAREDAVALLSRRPLIPVEAVDDDSATEIFAPPPATNATAGPRHAIPDRVRSAAPIAPQVPIRALPKTPGEASDPGLMDADDDDGDVRGVHAGLAPSQPGSVRPAAGAPPPRPSARPITMGPAEPRRYRAERADELTAPARRLRRDRDRLTLALVVLALSFVATLVLLLVLVLR